MPGIVHIGKMLAGIAFMLLAMNFMESSLRSLSGRTFKLFLKRQTNKRLKAAGGGAMVTALLQNSSITNLLVMGMAGTGILNMDTMLALILGANLGSTFNSWIVALFGFQFNIAGFALLLTGAFGICMIFSKDESKWRPWFKFLFSLALLFTALDFIRNGMEEFVKQTDLSLFRQFPAIVFLLLGIFLTAIVQTGSVTMAITLSSLYTNIISLYDGMAVILGAEVGTTLKLFIASAGGAAIKKRAALGNFIINAVTTLIVFVLLRPIHFFISSVIVPGNALIALVLFQTFVNLLSLILFLPFLNHLGKLLLRRYPDNNGESFFINKTGAADPDMAAEVLENETRYFIGLVIEFSTGALQLKQNENLAGNMHKKFYSKSQREKYEYIKHLHGEMHSFHQQLPSAPALQNSRARLLQLIASIRNGMYAAKSMADACHDIEQLRNSSNNVKYDFFLHSAKDAEHFYQQLSDLLTGVNGQEQFTRLTDIYRQITSGYSETLKVLYRNNIINRVNETEISTLINFNRELYTSYKSLLFSIKDYLLTDKEAAYFDTQPGFIR